MYKSVEEMKAFVDNALTGLKDGQKIHVRTYSPKRGWRWVPGRFFWNHPTYKYHCPNVVWDSGAGHTVFYHTSLTIKVRGKIILLLKISERSDVDNALSELSDVHEKLQVVENAYPLDSTERLEYIAAFNLGERSEAAQRVLFRRSEVCRYMASGLSHAESIIMVKHNEQ